MPKLSIITVNLNNAPGLRKTIESVLNQSFTDYEYIIIDGGSTDGSVDVIKEHADKIIMLVEMMMLGQKDLPCFQDGEQTVSKLKERFFPTKKMMTETEAKRFTEDLIM